MNYKYLRTGQIGSIFVFFLVCFIMFYKAPDRILNGYLWAEDVPVFLKGAYEIGIYSLPKPSAGYLHLIPRVLAYIQTFFGGVETAPLFYVTCCVFISSICAVYNFKISLQITGKSTIGFGIALTPYLIPHSGEVFLNITNLQWILAPTLFLLLYDLLVFDRSPRGVFYLKSFFIFSIGLSGPFMVMYIPMFFLVLWSKRATHINYRFGFLIVLTLTVAFLQFLATKSDLVVVQGIKNQFWMTKLIDDYFFQMFPLDYAHGNISPFEVTLILIPILTIIIIGALKSGFLVPSLLIYSLLFWVLGVLRVNDPSVITGPLAAASRYYFLPYTFFCWALLFLCTTYQSLFLKFACLMLLLLVFVKGLMNFTWEKSSNWMIERNSQNIYEITAPPGWKATIHVSQ